MEETQRWVVEYEQVEFNLWTPRTRTMTTINIKYVDPPKAGKKMGTVKTDDDKILGFFPDKISPQPGPAEVTVESREWKGTTLYSITAYKALPASKPDGAGAPAASSGAAPWWMPFVSNTVAHAIAAGAITSNEQIDDWAKAAKAAALALAADNNKKPDDEDSIPF
jgi:hypothetical protein